MAREIITPVIGMILVVIFIVGFSYKMISDNIWHKNNLEYIVVTGHEYEPSRVESYYNIALKMLSTRTVPEIYILNVEYRYKDGSIRSSDMRVPKSEWERFKVGDIYQKK